LSATKAYRLRSVTLHGNRYAYRQAGAGAGPVVVLIHGITSDSTTWAEVMPGLAKQLHGDRTRPARPWRLRQADGAW
jgi:pimeloyl-ACP methyl ester carboxylesterase